LQERHGMYLNGIMLVSVILSFQTARFDHGNDLPYILFLPTYTATAWYHQRLPAALQGDLRAAVREAEAFALGDYAAALMRGDALAPAERRRVAQKLARLSGLSLDYVERTNLRINIHRFVKELLRDERRTVGRLDSRFKGIDRDAVGEEHEYDPSLTNVLGPYAAAFNDYVRSVLKFESDLPYEILNRKVWPWRFDHDNQYIQVGETLRHAMTLNPYLKVFVANGYYDLATPHFATEYTFNHLGLDPELRANITMHHYEAGHMMYVHQPSLAQLHTDLAAFLASAIASA
jgi:carboxypeptidase C (cathepsin A)